VEVLVAHTVVFLLLVVQLTWNWQAIQRQQSFGGKFMYFTSGPRTVNIYALYAFI
jgi:hypothetical protein